MRSFLIFVVVLLPQFVFCDDTKTTENSDNERYSRDDRILPEGSLVCNDLNPQMDVDIRMVNFIFKKFIL